MGCACAGEIRLASNVRLWGWMADSSADPAMEKIIRAKRGALDYYRGLGFTHILYFIDSPYAPLFRKTAAGWIYNGGAYAAGDHSLSLARMKKETEARGMVLVPAMTSLSHMDAYIAMDSSISEFDRKNPRPRPPWTWPAAGKQAYAKYDGIAAAGPLGRNPGADQFFREYLRIIKAVWTADGNADGHPPFILIGHDELGYNEICLIKAGKSRHRPETKAALVAEEIHARAVQVAEIVDSSTSLLLFGDSFVPGDYGETYGLAGDAKTGAAGTLRILRDRFRLKDKLVVIPWIYSSLESDGKDRYRNVVLSKAKQLGYLDRLGYSYLIGAGEDGQEPFSPPVDRTLQSLFEWVRESRHYQAHRRGYAHMSFNNFETCLPQSDSLLPLCSGYSAPLLAYLAWSQAGGLPDGSFPKEYSPEVFQGVDFRKSRWEEKWQAGRHYPAPPKDSGSIRR